MSELLPRITEILHWSTLGPAAFADEIGVARAVMSHILSARNKASLEVVQKVLLRFKEISPAWLLLGQGSMLMQLGEETSHSDPVLKQVHGESSDANVSSRADEDGKVPTQLHPSTPPIPSKYGQERKVVRLMLLYSDGTFESFDQP